MLRLNVVLSNKSERIFKKYKGLYKEVNSVRNFNNDDAINLILENLEEDINGKV